MKANNKNKKKNISAKSQSLELREDVIVHLDQDDVKKVTVAFQNTLESERIGLNEAFALKDLAKVYFLAEKLLGAATYFKIKKFQDALHAVMISAYQKKLSQTAMKKLNAEFDDVVQLIKKSSKR